MIILKKMDDEKEWYLEQLMLGMQEETEDGFLDQLEEVYGEDQGPRQLHHSAECSTFGKIFNMDNNDFA